MRLKDLFYHAHPCFECKRENKQMMIQGTFQNANPFDLSYIRVGCDLKDKDEEGDLGGHVIKIPIRDEEGNLVDNIIRVCMGGPTLIDIKTSPVEWIRNIVDCFPKSGNPIYSVDRDDNVILGFSYKDKYYPCTNTLLSCSMLDPVDQSQRITYYEVEIPDGEALIVHISNIKDITPQPESWLLFEKTGESETTALPNPKPHNSAYAYKIIYEIEHLLRTILTNNFSDIDSLFKDIRMTYPKTETLYESLKRKRGNEESKLLVESNTQLIDYLDWNDWITIFGMERLFSSFPNRNEAMKSFKGMLERIRPIRNKVSHMREVESEEINTLRQALNKIKDLH